VNNVTNEKDKKKLSPITRDNDKNILIKAKKVYCDLVISVLIVEALRSEKF
jgi:hypothetical protein